MAHDKSALHIQYDFVIITSGANLINVLAAFLSLPQGLFGFL